MKKRILAIAAAVLIALVGFLWYGYRVRETREHTLQETVTSISGGEVTLNEVVPFAWDAVYTFAPYTSKEEIEAVIGFRSPVIRETYSEGMVQLVFVRGKQIAAMVCGYPPDLGYTVVFDGKITHAENAVFSVSREGGIVQLTRKE